VFDTKREVSEGWSDGGLIEFGNVDWRVGWLSGVWRFGGLWNPSCGLCTDLPHPRLIAVKVQPEAAL